jgi:spore coat protein U-like protein
MRRRLSRARHALAVLAFALGLGAPSAEALLCLPLLACSCTVSASDLDFGAFDPLSGSQDAVGEIDVDCTGVIDIAPSVLVRLDRGQWGTMAARNLRNGNGDLLDYNIYTTSQHSSVWGDGGGGSSSVVISGGLIVSQHWSVSRDMYGLATPSPATKPGAYSDTVVVRITW